MTQINGSEKITDIEKVVPVPFGKEFREKYYTFGNVVNLNHGSFGACSQPVLSAKIQHYQDVLAFPDRFFKYTLFEKVAKAREVAAEFLDAEVNNLVLTGNATTAINTVLRSFPLEKGDKILYCSTIYGACRNTLKFLHDRVGVELVEIDIGHPMSHKEIVAAYTNAMDSQRDAPFKMAFFDVVSSAPAYRMPWETLVKECRDRGVLSVVDGAHSAGLLPISLRTVKPDFFTTNFHKWAGSPNSCAALYVDAQWHHVVHTLPISAVYDPDNVVYPPQQESQRLANSFNYTGTIDYSSLLSIVDSIAFREKVGGEEKIMAYCYDLAQKGGHLAAKELGTEVLTGKGDKIDTNMINVRLPLDTGLSQLSDAAVFIHKYLEEHNTYIPLLIFDGKLWSRWSAQIYLDLDDFKYGIETLKAAINTWKAYASDVDSS